MSHDRFLLVGFPTSDQDPVVAAMAGSAEVVRATTLEEAVQHLRAGHFQGFCVRGESTAPGFLLEAGGLLEQLPDGVALLDLDARIEWSNTRFVELAGHTAPVGMPFFQAFGDHEIIGPDFCPFHTAIGTGEVAQTIVKRGEKSFLSVEAKPIAGADSDLPAYLLVTLRDVSGEVVQRNKLRAIYQAGIELGDMPKDDLLDFSVEERVELLKAKILQFTKDLLQFETVEVRVVDQQSGELKPLLAVGLLPEAVSRTLFAKPEDNGVTGFVAATGRSYLCDDTLRDPLYIRGVEGARSSLTVPLILHDEILGTFNVESPHPGAFNDNDLQFLELFCREVALALNTLELLVAEQESAAASSAERILFEVADPVDLILNDATWLLEKLRDQPAAVRERVSAILAHTRMIRERILAEGQTERSLAEPLAFPELVDKRILVIDADADIRRSAHEILGQYHCRVETAQFGEEAMAMVRTHKYDAVVSDIRMPDFKGDRAYREIRQLHPKIDVILAAGFGYDGNHSIVKARQMGAQSVIYKPFRVDQLVKALQKAVTTEPPPLRELPESES